MIAPDTPPPSIRATVPLTNVRTGASDTRSEGGQAPIVTRVEESYAINPIPWLFCSPIKARKSPIPAEELIRIGFGISLASLVRNPTTEMSKKIKPSMKTAVNALSYETLPDPSQSKRKIREDSHYEAADQGRSCGGHYQIFPDGRVGTERDAVGDAARTPGVGEDGCVDG
ncbi:hypothetical protein G4B88_010178 [Cannabis sativa]|uniref:Uncharacterized protein n=1 Tax=Cannabis sativa TaxID=3483 RepID=A0A7J6E303_CANSA|nr:hypothetical protein G4B88_010178 [Cannabis sativa]